MHRVQDVDVPDRRYALMKQLSSLLSAQASGSATTYSLLVPQRGTDNSQRIGREIRVRRVIVRIFVRPILTAAASYAANLVAFALVYDKNPNAVIGTTWVDVFNSAVPMSTPDPAGVDRYLILGEKVSTIDPYAYSAANVVSVGGDVARYVEIDVGDLDLPMVFNATVGGFVTSVVTGWFALVATAFTANACLFEYYQTMYYEDV